MKFTKLVPNIFYRDIRDGLTFFVDCLEFQIGYEEINSARPFCVLEKDELKIYLFQDQKYADEHYPELRLETKDINQVYESISTRFPQFLHPNLSVVTLRPWGAKEFAIKDKQVGVIIQQW